MAFAPIIPIVPPSSGSGGSGGRYDGLPPGCYICEDDVCIPINASSRPKPPSRLFLLTAILMLLPLVAAVQYAPPGGRCGPEFNATCNRICCSGAGYCGTSEDFCSVPNNCQEGWGWCDSKIMPSGADITHDTRKYIASIPAKVDKCTIPKTLALTFDDGPSNYTNAVLDILKEHKARATFFVAGVNNGHGQLDIRWSATLRRMITEGHQVGSHTWSHPNLDKLSSADRKMELWKNERAITNIIGKMPTFMRPPMVICGDACMKDMKDLGYHVVGWEVDSQDWHSPQPSLQETTARLVGEMHKRQSMFLIQHDTSQMAIDVLKSVLQNKPADWKAVPLVECLGHSLDDAFRYPEWLEYNSTVQNGCLVTAPAFCIRAPQFKTRKACLRNAKLMQWSTLQCSHWGLDLTNPVIEHCHHLRRLADATTKFCKQCKDGKDCDHDHLKYKGL